MEQKDNLSELRTILEMNDAFDLARLGSGPQVELKRKVVLFGRNVLRIVESGNEANKASLSKKCEHYLNSVESGLNDDAMLPLYIKLLQAIQAVL